MDRASMEIFLKLGRNKSDGEGLLASPCLNYSNNENTTFNLLSIHPRVWFVLLRKDAKHSLRQTEL